VCAALVSDGKTIINSVYYGDRGYENIEETRKAAGAELPRVGDMFRKRASAPVAGWLRIAPPLPPQVTIVTFQASCDRFLGPADFNLIVPTARLFHILAQLRWPQYFPV
jgi:hypothetical protein